MTRAFLPTINLGYNLGWYQRKFRGTNVVSKHDLEYVQQETKEANVIWMMSLMFIQYTFGG